MSPTLNRMIIANKVWSYFQACKEDIKTECGDILRDIKNKKVEDGRGMIISCLKDKIDKISVECEDQITAILEQEVDNYLLDPLLNKFCENDIEVLCGNEPDDMVCFIYKPVFAEYISISSVHLF